MPRLSCWRFMFWGYDGKACLLDVRRSLPVVCKTELHRFCCAAQCISEFAARAVIHFLVLLAVADGRKQRWYAIINAASDLYLTVCELVHARLSTAIFHWAVVGSARSRLRLLASRGFLRKIVALSGWRGLV